jgi:hypothetical protein|tara:strand:- start:2963 stop:3157 length:195 start_codon:yes stop_codon:yes gene_type:complete
MERGLMMVVHSALISLVAYFLMIFLLKQRQLMAENRSVLMFAIVLAYMVLFGHRWPNRLNSGLF